jgi:hypothetical protein
MSGKADQQACWQEIDQSVSLAETQCKDKEGNFDEWNACVDKLGPAPECRSSVEISSAVPISQGADPAIR